MEIKDEKDKEFFFKEVSNASDRTAVISFTAYLDDRLEDALKAHLRADKDALNRMFKATGALGALQNKALLAYLMGLLTKEMLADIKAVADVRNMFGHLAEPLSFGNREIRKLVESISIQERIFGEHAHSARQPKPWDKDFTRFIFISSVDVISGHLLAMTRDPNHPKIL